MHIKELGAVKLFVCVHRQVRFGQFATSCQKPFYCSGNQNLKQKIRRRRGLAVPIQSVSRSISQSIPSGNAHRCSTVRTIWPLLNRFCIISVASTLVSLWKLKQTGENTNIKRSLVKRQCLLLSFFYTKVIHSG